MPYQFISFHINHINPYHIMYHISIISCHTSYDIIPPQSYYIISCHITSTISYHFISYHVTSYSIISCNITSHHITSCHIVSYHVIYHVISYHIISNHIISHHTIPYLIICYHFFKHDGGHLTESIANICFKNTTRSQR